jgi:hypothetical protein
MARIFPFLTAIAALVACGVVHGLWTDRWAHAPEPAAAAARLENLPLTLGDWDGETLPVEPGSLGAVSGCLYRQYVNRHNGNEVNVFLVCGRPGPVAIHTPDVCYGASGYTVGPRSTFSFPSGASPSVTFYTATFHKTRAAGPTHLRVFWSWLAGDHWTVADNPRLTFARQPVLYKLYLVHRGAAANETIADDPCVTLMTQLLPELQRTLFPGGESACLSE